MKKTLDQFRLLADAILNDEKQHPVSPFIKAEKLYDELDFTLQDNPINDDVHFAALKKLALSSTKTASKGFFNQLFGGRNEKAILGELLSVILNNSMYTYKAAGVQVGIEKTVLRKVCDIIGWDEQSDGTFASGGSLTNFMSMVMARDFSEEKHPGSYPRSYTVYTSIESHYSIPKNASLCGIGRKNVRYIASDDRGRMDVTDLEFQIVKDIKDGYIPTLINATAGTTVLGAFDNVASIQKIAAKYNIWMHVDGAYQGAVLFSKKYGHYLNGLEKVDSFSFNAHKMFGTPLTCSLLLTKNKERLYRSFSAEADYLFQTDVDEFNPGKTSLQCGRRNDALKFWTLWKSVGTSGLEKMVNHQFDLADYAREYVRKHKDYQLYSFDDSISICFNYKGISPQLICTELYKSSKLLVGYGSFKGTNFIRLVTINAENTIEDIHHFFEVLETFTDTYQLEQEKEMSSSFNQ